MFTSATPIQDVKLMPLPDLEPEHPFCRKYNYYQYTVFYDSDSDFEYSYEKTLFKKLLFNSKPLLYWDHIERKENQI